VDGSLIDDSTGLRYVHLEISHAERLQELEYLCFPTIDRSDLYDAGDIGRLARAFPEGNFAVFDADRAVGMGLGIRVHFDFDHTQHSLSDLTGSEETGDDPTGRWYYGTDISVDPTYRRRGIGQNLYQLRKRAVRDLGLDGIVAGGVIPGFVDHKHVMSAEEYVQKVVAGELYDATLSFQLENGFEAPGVIGDYITDPAVDNWASLIVWHNPGLDA
jgi:GNAT superfamily N-acetyltransferase